MITQIIAHQKFIRQTPRKVRLVADMVRNLPLNQAISQLRFTRKRAARALLKTITQAKANAINNTKLDENNLFINQIQIMEGPTYKRWQPISRGRAHPILKRTSHIKVVLGVKKETDSQLPKPVAKKLPSTKTSVSQKNTQSQKQATNPKKKGKNR